MRCIPRPCGEYLLHNTHRTCCMVRRLLVGRTGGRRITLPRWEQLRRDRAIPTRRRMAWTGDRTSRKPKRGRLSRSCSASGRRCRGGPGAGRGGARGAQADQAGGARGAQADQARGARGTRGSGSVRKREVRRKAPSVSETGRSPSLGSDPSSLALIHPSVPWPLPATSEVMKMSPAKAIFTPAPRRRVLKCSPEFVRIRHSA